IFVQLGNDVIQGDGCMADHRFGADGWIEANPDKPVDVGAGRPTAGAWDPSQPLFVSPSRELPTDGDDYIEGNGGNDVIFGNLGQDDIIGGSSTLFGLGGSEILRPDGTDLIFGGAGTDIARNDLGDTSTSGHARDADVIIGDNGNIFRLVGVNGQVGVGDTRIAIADGYLAFNYDNYDAFRIVARAAELLDYTPGGLDFNAAAAGMDNGAADEVHGESGDDQIYGMVGDDVLFGDGQNDVLIGGYGADWISGGTGDDGILGDDGRLLVSRNSSSYGERLYGIAAIPTTDINRLISTPDRVNNGILNVEGALKYTADLTPENLQPNQPTPPNPLFRPLYASDMIYGGWGNDCIHGGAGDDAISGAEAPALSYTNNYNKTTGAQLNAVPIESDFAHPFNPGNVLGYNPSTTKFALYDANDPLRTILLDPSNGSLWKGAAGSGLAWILNFSATEGPIDTFWIQGQTTYAGVPTDGDDHIFGDLGNDWMVGGTGRDSLFGGWGDDLLNLDDDLASPGTVSKKGNTFSPACDTNPSYEDMAFGGAGIDVFLINTNGDRGLDWMGEFNSFYTPFAQYGAVSVSRMLRPSEPEYLYAMAQSDGADPTLAAQYGSDPARHGEPFGELGLVTSKDAAWGAQSGSSRDPQPGNTGGGKVDLNNGVGTAGTKPIYMTAEPSARPTTGTVPILTDAQLAGITAVAKQIWERSLGSEDSRLARLESLHIMVGNLPQDKLGATVGGIILIDTTAAGRGWLIDRTPAGGSGTVGGHGLSEIDLLTVVLHELGHALGFDDLTSEAEVGDVMYEMLPAGVRRTETRWTVPRETTHASGTWYCLHVLDTDNFLSQSWSSAWRRRYELFVV
ncbi:MAG: hypothetical protein M1274_05810, partial [Actinobacteria bacterium]|nr:hypothetical protein [Actinomycetota bacterium]